MVIRSGGMYAARSIFAEVSLPSVSKNAYLADLPPGSPDRDERQIRQEKAWEGDGVPVPVTVQSMTEQLQKSYLITSRLNCSGERPMRDLNAL